MNRYFYSHSFLPSLSALSALIAQVGGKARALAALACLALATPAAFAFVLVTEEEARTFNRDMGSVIAPMSVPANAVPAIEVVNPQIMAGPVPSPVSIELSFRTDGAPIDMKSFAAHYGSLRLDITDRIMERAKRTDSGLKIDNAQIPKGTHRLFLTISDVKGRRTDRELRLQVQ
jgi:hypothetical protein